MAKGDPGSLTDTLSAWLFAYCRAAPKPGDCEREKLVDLFEYDFRQQVTHHSLFSSTLLLLKYIACLIKYALIVGGGSRWKSRNSSK